MLNGNDSIRLLSKGLAIILVALPAWGHAFQADQMQFFSRATGRKQYELQDHLNNVRTVTSDMKIPLNASDHTEGFKTVMLSSTHYDPFGMELPDRSYSSEVYRFGFNGKEKDNEWKGSGNSYDFDARIYDARLGRWLSADPLAEKFPDQSPYDFAFNDPVRLADPDGREPKSKTEVILWRSLQQSELATVLRIMEKTEMYKSLLKSVDQNLGGADIHLQYWNPGLHTHLMNKDLASASEYSTYDDDSPGGLGMGPVIYWNPDYSRWDLPQTNITQEKTVQADGTVQTTTFSTVVTSDRTATAGVLFHEFIHLTQNIDGDEEHEQMATPLGRLLRIGFMMEFDKASGQPLHSNEWYYFQSWVGLQNTQTYNNLPVEEQERIDRGLTQEFGPLWHSPVQKKYKDPLYRSSEIKDPPPPKVRAVEIKE